MLSTDSVKGGPDECIFYQRFRSHTKSDDINSHKKETNPTEINITSHCGLNTHEE